MSDGFHTTCTTCSSRLLVKDASVIGQILACPKCGGMVLVEAPADENVPVAVLTSAERPLPESTPESATNANPVSAPPTDFAQGAGHSWIKLAFAGAGAIVCMSTIGWYAWSRNSVAPNSITPMLEVEHNEIEQPPVYEPPEVADADVSDTIDDNEPELVVSEDEKPDVAIVADEVDPFHEADLASLSDPEPPAKPLTPAAKPFVPTNALSSLSNLLGGSPIGASEPLVGDSRKTPSDNPIRTSVSNAAQKRRVKDNIEQKIRAVRFKDVPLLDFLRSMTVLSGVPISLDPAVLEQTGRFATAPVSVAKMDSLPMDILQAALAPIGMQPVVEDFVIRITTPRLEDTASTAVVFDVGDLLDGDARELDWANFVATLVEPTTWAAGGGKGTIELDGDQLKISNTRLVAIRTAFLLEKIRAARSLPPQKKIPSHLTSLEPRWTALSRSLAQPIDVDVWDDSNLIDIVSSLEEASGVRILMDWQSLADRGINPETEARLYVRDTPLEAAIEMLVGERDLAIVPVNKDTIQITTDTTKSAMTYVELYSFKKMGNTGRKIVEDLMLRGSAALDPASEVAIVVGNPDLHRQLSR